MDLSVLVNMSIEKIKKIIIYLPQSNQAIIYCDYIIIYYLSPKIDDSSQYVKIYRVSHTVVDIGISLYISSTNGPSDSFMMT